MNNINYQKELDKVINSIKAEKTLPKLLLHSCCAPCSSYVLEYLTDYFEIGLLYYNPNISPREEYTKRIQELERLVNSMPLHNNVKMIPTNYDPKEFFDAVKGFETCKEGGERCFICYELRLREAARCAKKLGYDYFATTLTISPLKNAVKINEIGQALEKEYGVCLLPSDFKKRNGYKRSIELSAEYDLYRQDFCGCVFSKMERDSRCQKE